MWRRQRRLQRLESELAQARAERAALSRRLEAFEQIAADVGRSLPETTDSAVTGEDPSPGDHASEPDSVITQSAGRAPWPGPAEPVPPVLLAAARDLRPEDVPVRLTVAGQDIVAVVGGPGDPREWWTAIWQLSHYAPGARRASL